MNRSAGSTIAIACTLLATFAILPLRAASVDESASYVFDKNLWARMDWRKPESSTLWKSLPWTLSSDGTANRPTITIFSAPFKISWIGGVLHFEASDTFQSCNGLESKTTAHFGKPIEDDGSIVIRFSETRSMKVVAEFHQWDIGKTRILAVCRGVMSSPAEADNPDKLTWALAFSTLARLPKLTPKFALRCTRTINYSDGTTHEATEMAMWVDPYMKQVTNADEEVLADTGTFVATDNQIRFSATRNSVKSDYAIDRITGSLSATVSQDDQQIGTIMGNCEKATSLRAKF